MRFQTACWPAAGLAALIMLTSHVHAGETFVCDDGRMLEVTSANRAKLKDDPCVAGWFQKDRERREVRQSPVARSPKSTRVVTVQGEKRAARPSNTGRIIMTMTRPRRSR